MAMTPDARGSIPRSMRHEHRSSHRLQHVAGHAAQNDLAQLGVAVTAHHDQRSGAISDIGQDGTGDIDVGCSTVSISTLTSWRVRCVAISTPRITLLLPLVFS